MTEEEKRGFQNFIQTVLNNEFLAGLKPNVPFNVNNGVRIEFDFSDRNKLIFVQIIFQHDSRLRAEIRDRLSENLRLISGSIARNDPYKFVIVFAKSLSANDRKYYESEFSRPYKDSVFVIDREDAIILGQKHKVNYNNFFHFDDYLTEGVPDLVENAIRKFQDINSQIFVGGHTWSSENLLETFINEKRWENGHDDRNTQAVNSARIGDVVLMKSTFSRQGQSFLRVKAVGIITNNRNDGHNLDLTWIKLGDFIDIPGLGKLRNTFQRLNEKDYSVLFVTLLKANPILVDEIINYVINTKKEKYRNKSSQNSRKYWWYRNNEYDWKFTDHKLNDNIQLSVNVPINAGLKFFDKFFNARNGDYVLGFEGKNELAVIHQMKVTDAARKDTKDKLDLLIFESYYPPISFSRLRELESLRGTPIVEDPNAVLIELTLVQYQEIISLYSVSQISDRNKLKSDDLPPGDSEDNADRKSNNDDSDTGNDRIPFHLDQVTDDDQLGREPVAKAFADLIVMDVFTPKLDHSFIVHLQGAWGSGKSSFLKLIEKKLNKDEDKKKWVIINYNAWENQHIIPPWWTFIDRIYRHSLERFSWGKWCGRNLLNGLGIRLWIKEKLRRILRYSSWKNFFAFTLTIILIVFLFEVGEGLFEQLSKVNSPENVSNNSNGMALEVFTKLLLSLGALAGAIFSFSKFLTYPFFMRNSDEARSFVSRSADPMEKIRNHFSELIDDIASEDREVAIFIDDIDRCNKEFVVNLLEGIQTLFKEKRVLYIIAGDKRWITKSFGNTYQDFKIDSETTDELGDLFLEKVFQLSLRIPEVTEDAKKEYWHHILQIKSDIDSQRIEGESMKDLPKDLQETLKSDLNENRNNLNDAQYLNSIGDKYNLTGDTVSNIVIELSNANNEELRHLLIDFHKLIDPNPRKIKRLVNNYTMTRSTLQAERRTYEPKKLFRWLALVNQFPKFEEFVWNELSLTKLNDEKKRELIPADKISDFDALLFNKNGDFGGPITEQEILSIIGRN